MKKLFQSKIIWEVKMGRFGQGIKNMNKSKKSTDKSSILLQNKCQLKPDLKVAHHTGGKWFIHAPQAPQEESVTKPRTLLMTIFILECKSDITGVRGNLSNPFFEKKVRGQKHPKEAYKCRNSIPYINDFLLYCQHLLRTTSARTG